MAVTFYTLPKPWLPEYADIQRAAIGSLVAISGSPDRVVLLGDEHGTAAAAAEFGVRHRSSIATNQWGTPLLTSVIETIRSDSNDGTTDIVCYINSDIVLGPDFIETVDAVISSAVTVNPEWLIIGQRTNVNISHPSKLAVSDIRNIAVSNGRRHGIDGIDYFVFPRATFDFVYPFAIGKFAWDQWLVGNVFRRGLVCIDATETVLAVHLNASWYFQGQPETSWSKISDSEEARINRNFDYYQRNIANGTTHYTRKIPNRAGDGQRVGVLAHTMIG